MKIWRSLRVRLTASYLAMALLVLTIAGALFWRVARDYADSVERERRSSYYGQVHNYLTGLPQGQYSAAQILQMVRQRFPEVAGETRELPSSGESAEGNPPAGAPPPAPGGLFFRPRLPGRQAGPDQWTDLYMTPTGPAAFRFRIPPETPGAVFRTFVLQLLVFLGLTFSVAALIGWWFSRWLSRPLSALSKATAALAAGDYARQVDQAAVSELDELVAQFNGMVLSVHESQRALTAERDVAKRFAADAAHEFKTPLSTLRAYADVLAERPERLTQALPAIHRQIDRMDYTVSGLLDIASISEGTALRLETQDLAIAVSQLEPWLADMAVDYRQHLETDIGKSPLPVRLDSSLLALVLENLVNNACKYSAAGSTVRIALGLDGQSARLSIADQGPGIAPADLPFIFERFHRGVETQEIPGSGLGLSIVREAVQRLGGRIEVESRIGEGSTFQVHLPLMSDGARDII